MNLEQRGLTEFYLNQINRDARYKKLKKLNLDQINKLMDLLARPERFDPSEFLYKTNATRRDVDEAINKIKPLIDAGTILLTNEYKEKLINNLALSSRNIILLRNAKSDIPDDLLGILNKQLLTDELLNLKQESEKNQRDLDDFLNELELDEKAVEQVEQVEQVELLDQLAPEEKEDIIEEQVIRTGNLFLVEQAVQEVEAVQGTVTDFLTQVEETVPVLVNDDEARLQTFIETVIESPDQESIDSLAVEVSENDSDLASILRTIESDSVLSPEIIEESVKKLSEVEPVGLSGPRPFNYYIDSAKLFLKDRNFFDPEVLDSLNSIEKTKWPIITNFIIKTKGPELFISEPESPDVFDSVHTLVQIYFCLLRNLHRGSRRSTVTVNKDAYEQLSNTLTFNELDPLGISDTPVASFKTGSSVQTQIDRGLIKEPKEKKDNKILVSGQGTRDIQVDNIFSMARTGYKFKTNRSKFTEVINEVNEVRIG